MADEQLSKKIELISALAKEQIPGRIGSLQTTHVHPVVYIEKDEIEHGDVGLLAERIAKNVAFQANIMVGSILENHRHLRFDIPVDWFQHFKQEKFPEFLLKLFPVKIKTLNAREWKASANFPRRAKGTPLPEAIAMATKSLEREIFWRRIFPLHIFRKIQFRKIRSFIKLKFRRKTENEKLYEHYEKLQTGKNKKGNQ